jgi:DNA-binding XRE family transcriptional regulator
MCILMSNPRYRKVDPRVRDRRDALGLTQEELADIVGLSRRAIVDIEKGKPAEQFNAKAVEQAVGLGLPDWVLSPARLVEDGGAAARIHIAACTWPEMADRYYLFVRSLLLDATGMHDKSFRLLESARTCDGVADDSFECAALIHLACIQDHRRNYLDARQAAEQAVALAKASSLAPSLLWWSQYQLAIAFSNLDDLAGAYKLLTALEGSATSNDCEAAALHQLGIVQLRWKHFDRAASFFVRCIEIRPMQSPRLAYEYHGLGKVYGEQQNWKLCSKFLKRALITALRHGFDRYVKEIRSTAQVYESRSGKRLL